MKNLKNKMSLEKGKLSGGFSSLSAGQISKIKGGKKGDDESNNTICPNGSCSNGNCDIPNS